GGARSGRSVGLPHRDRVMPAGTPNNQFRFGVFEVDARSGEVRKAGSRIKLQDRPLQVLLALLERPGEVITREELRERVWPNESFGDFDHAVNVAVAKARIALDDSADTPRYIETLPKRGYRFIFPLSEPTGSIPPRIPEKTNRQAIAEGTPANDVATSAKSVNAAERFSGRTLVAAIAVVVVLAAVFLIISARR